VGLTKIDPANYHPFAPNGFEGIHHGAAIVFFAYIGFDAISTAAEETINPQRNLPIGILGGLAICTLVYVIVGAVLTGMVPYRELDPSLHADPLAYALQRVGMQGAGWLVALGAVFSMTAVLLVFQYGQPRIFYAMARDGLLPKWAAKVHQKSRVPYATTLLTGLFVASWSLIGDAGETYDLTNIGTLFAFALVCIGVLVLRYTQPERPRPFRVPGRDLIPFLAFYSSNLIVYWAGWDVNWKLFATVGLGMILFFVYNGLRRDNPPLDLMSGATWVLPWLGGMCLLSYLGDYPDKVKDAGNTATIGFGWGFVAVLVLSALVYFVGLRMRLPRERVEEHIADTEAEAESEDRELQDSPSH
jgi:APA family basic amino acid/polyamine antiporter